MYKALRKARVASRLLDSFSLYLFITLSGVGIGMLCAASPLPLPPLLKFQSYGPVYTCTCKIVCIQAINASLAVLFNTIMFQRSRWLVPVDLQNAFFLPCTQSCLECIIIDQRNFVFWSGDLIQLPPILTTAIIRILYGNVISYRSATCLWEPHYILAETIITIIIIQVGSVTGTDCNYYLC